MKPPPEDNSPDRRRSGPWAWGLVVLILLVGVVAALARPRGLAVQAVAVKRADILVPVQCDGTLEPAQGGELRSAEAATVAELLAHEGDHVVEGAPLLRLENAELSQKSLDARSQSLRLAAERADAQAELDDLERERKHRREVVEADGRLLEAGAITRATAENDERALAQADDRARAAHERVTGLDGPGSRLALAQKAAEEFDRRVAALSIHAPSAGVVYGLPRRAGEAVAAGQVIASVIDPAHRRLRARVDQPDLPRIATGQRLLVGFDGLPRERWEGKVTSVAPGLREVAGREVGEVLGEIGDPQGRLPTNAAVDVQIITGEKTGALVVPRAGVVREGDRRYVYLLEDGQAHRRDVQVGLTGLTEVEIVSGVKEQDRVILPGSTALSEGLRVRAGGA